MNPAPASPAKGAELTDRELIRALRDRVRPAKGDPVDKVDVRGDASDVVKFADILEDIGSDAARTQQAKLELREKLEEVAALRDELESDAVGLLSEDDSSALSERLRAIEERSGEPVFEPAEAKQIAAEEIADEPAARPPEDFHVKVDVRLQEAETRLKDESRALAAREDAAIERADRLQRAVGGGEDESSVVRLALETAQKIAAERNRAITAQTDRLEARNVGALSNG